MLYCSKNALNNIVNNENDDIFYINKDIFELFVKTEKKLIDSDTCVKDNIGSATYQLKVIANDFMFIFNYTKYTVDWDSEYNLLFKQNCNIEKYKKNNIIICTKDDLNEKTIDVLYIMENNKISNNEKKELNKKYINNLVEINNEDITENLKEKKFAIIPLKVENNEYFYKKINIGLNETYMFYKVYCPKLYFNIGDIMNDFIKISDDFINYKYCLFEKTLKKDSYSNEIIYLKMVKELKIEEIIELDITGKSHLYLIKNYSNIDTNLITDSLKNILNKKTQKIEAETLMEYAINAKLTNIDWIEDYFIKQNNYTINIVLTKLAIKLKKYANFEKIINHLFKGENSNELLKLMKSNKKLVIEDYEERLIKKYKNSTYLIDFVKAYSNSDKMKERIIESCIIEKSAYHINSLLYIYNYDINLLKYVISKKSSIEFKSSLNYYLQDLLYNNKYDEEFVEICMNLLFEVNDLEYIARRFNRYSNNFYAYKSDISNYLTKLKEKEKEYIKEKEKA